MPQSVPIKYQASSSLDQPKFKKIIEDLLGRRFFAETKQYEELSQWLNKRRKYKSCGIISGSSGSGKSRAAKEYDAVVTGRRGVIRRIKPLHSLYIRSFSSWGTQDFCRHALTLINHGVRKGRPRDVRLRTWETFEEFGLELLLVDNAHHLTEKILFDLVECYDEFKIATVLIGPHEDLEARLELFGLRRKFNSHHQFQSLSSKQVVGVLTAFEKDFLNLPEDMNFFDSKTLFAICKASGGDLSDLDKLGCNFNVISDILVLTILESSENGTLHFDKQVLKKVLHEFGCDSDLIVVESDNNGTGIAG